MIDTYSQILLNLSEGIWDPSNEVMAAIFPHLSPDYVKNKADLAKYNLPSEQIFVLPSHYIRGVYHSASYRRIANPRFGKGMFLHYDYCIDRSSSNLENEEFDLADQYSEKYWPSELISPEWQIVGKLRLIDVHSDREHMNVFSIVYAMNSDYSNLFTTTDKFMSSEILQFCKSHYNMSCCHRCGLKLNNNCPNCGGRSIDTEIHSDQLFQDTNALSFKSLI